MSEETVIPSIWASMISWFTPTILFILLNIVIGTIAVTSRFANQKPHQQTREEEDHHQQQQRFHQQLVRAPSNVIQRLKSINLYHFKTEDLNPFSSFSSHDHIHPHEQRVEETHQDHHHQQPSVIQRLKSINLYSFKVEDLNPFHHDHKLDETQAADHAHQQQQQLPQSRLARAPSNVIQRLKSINLSDLNLFPTFQPQPQPQPPPPQMINHGIKKTKTPVRKQREISSQDIDEFDHHHQEVRRSNSDRRPAKLVSQKDKIIKKSMSAKLDFWNFGNRAEEEEEETEEVVAVRGRRPSTVKVMRETSTTTTKVKVKASEAERFGDEEVDAKADDFISRFKHQLKLQRLDSIMRNKDDLAAGGN